MCSILQTNSTNIAPNCNDRFHSLVYDLSKVLVHRPLNLGYALDLEHQLALQVL